MKRIYLLLLLVLTIASCKEDVSLPEECIPISGEPQYGIPFDVAEVKDLAFYEVNLRAFSASGDLQGVIDKLDHIASLGTKVIWLMPIHPIGTINSVNSPYSVANYTAVGEEFGSLQDLQELTDGAHARGMAVIMDWVANHTAWDHPWITEHPDWYTQDANGNIIHPPGTNWLDVADLNFDHQDMRDEMIASMRYWLMNANVDGFRCDYADGVPFSFWQTAIHELRSIPSRELIFLAEGDRDDHFEAGFDLDFGWAMYTQVKDVFAGQPAMALLNTNASINANIPEGKAQLRFTTNHDQSAWEATPINIFGSVDAALAASVINAYLDQVPLLYSSQEVGQVDNLPFFSNNPIDWNANSAMLSAYQDMMMIYHTSPAARSGAIESFTNANVVCFRKTLGADAITIIVNVRNSVQNYVINNTLQGTYLDQSGNVVNLEANLELDPYEHLILVSN